jgi:hypothetical protein
MRSARLILATAAASAVLVLGAPGAYAGGDSSAKDESSSSYGQEHGKDGKHHKHGKHHWPHGGVHTGGGALTAVVAEDWSTGKASEAPSKAPSEAPKENGDKGTGKDGSGKDYGKDAYGQDSYGKDAYGQDSYGKDWKGKHDKPHGGVHTGGGGLAEPSVTAGGLAVLGVAAAGMYAARRKKAAGSVA